MFKEGDIVKVVDNCSGAIKNKKYILWFNKFYSHLYTYDLDDINRKHPKCGCTHNWILFKEKQTKKAGICTFWRKYGI